jgi:hypothetical protein
MPLEPTIADITSRLRQSQFAGRHVKSLGIARLAP